MLRQLADSRPYGTWIRDVPASLTAPRPPATEPLLEWGFRPRLPPWATAEAVSAVTEQITAAAGAEPLSPRRGQHRELEAMRYLSRMTRQFEQLAGRAGLTFAAPYYDDRVVEAGLSVRAADRVTPWRYKPLIVEAMRGIVPADACAGRPRRTGPATRNPGCAGTGPRCSSCWRTPGWTGSASSTPRRSGPSCAPARSRPHLQFGVLDQVVACEVWLRPLDVRRPLPT